MSQTGVSVPLASTVQTTERKEPIVIGKPLKRMEDPKFITGSGRFMDDIVLPKMLHAVFVRSLQAHAKIVKVDASEARKAPGVRLVLTPEDAAKGLNMMSTVREGGDSKPTKRHHLALDEANFAGEPVALVVADDPGLAEDAAELVQVEYEPLPVIVDIEKALEKGSPKVHSYLADNLAYYSENASGDIKKAFKSADHIIKVTLEFPRLNAVPMETRDMIASFDRSSNFLTAYVSCQSAHEMRDEIAEAVRLPGTSVRVIAPDMGGGFGQKGYYAEHGVVCLASIRLGRPVKWVESRRENMMSSSMGRGQKQYVEAAVRKDGKVLGLKVKAICDGGAYSDWSISMPETTVAMACGVYDIGAFYGEAVTAFTNKSPIGAYRGASRPEAAYLIERTMDVIARRLKLDPVKIRMKNFIPKAKFPYKSIGGLTYDSGDYEMNLVKALGLAKFDQWRAFQREARAKGRLVGIGVITYVEVCGFGAGYPQTAAVTVTQQGSVIIHSGTNPHGQGHWTAFAQIVAEELGVDTRDVTALFGDTSSLPYSTITAGSRSAVVGGTAVYLATMKVKEKMARIAAKMLDSKSDKLVFRDGKVTAPNGKSVPFVAVAGMAYRPNKLPPGMEATLYEYCAYAPPDNVFPFGTHVAVVDVDKETGLVKILKYVAVDDVGKVLNPLIVEGQVQGGALQGIAQALLEEIVYDENGQLLTSTLSDYLIPSTDTAPMIECYRTETPSPHNPLGLKGVGEAGTIAATPAIANAVEDALSPYGATVEKIPLTPANVWSLINKKQT